MSYYIKQCYIAKELGVDKSNVSRFTKQVAFYLKRYPNIKYKVMQIHKDLTAKKTELEQWLVDNYNADIMLVREKQKELENVINQLNK